MNMSLPTAVSTFFAISNGGDPAQVSDCFQPDASVIDEKQTHQGLDAIEDWQRKARQAFTYQVEPVETSSDKGMLVVKANLEGNFPGSPVQLDHLFELEDGLIRSLEIQPSAT